MISRTRAFPRLCKNGWCLSVLGTQRKQKYQGQLVYIFLSQSAAGKALIDQSLAWEPWLCEAGVSLLLASTSTSPLEGFSLTLSFLFLSL